MSESSLQAKLIRYLKAKGCYVIKTTPGNGTPVGCPDIFFFCDGFWGAIEAKASRGAKFQPLQKVTIEKLDKMSWCRVVYPENYQEIRAELELLLR